MIVGDVSVFQDSAGVEHVAIVSHAHTDGTVDLVVLKTNARNVQRSSQPAPLKFFDPDFVEEAPAAAAATEAPAEVPPNVGLSSVPRDEGDDVEQPEENPAHGAPADVTPPESA